MQVATLEDDLTKLSILLTYLALVLLGIYPKELKAYVPTKNPNMDIYSSCIHNCQNLEAMKMPSPR